MSLKSKNPAGSPPSPPPAKERDSAESSETGDRSFYGQTHQQVEERLRQQAALLEQISDAVIRTDMAFVIRSWNRAAEEIYGWEADDVLGVIAGQILRTRFMNGGADEAAASLMSTGRWDAEVEQQRKDGTRFPVLASVSLITDGEGKPSGMVAVNRDITELVRSRDALREAEDRYRHLFDLAPLIYLEFEVGEPTPGQIQPVIRDANQAYLVATGFRREEVIGHPFLPKLEQGSRQVALEGFQKVLGGSIVEGERVLLTRDGGRLYTLLRTVPRLGRDGQVVTTLAMYLDISERKRAEERQRKEAERTRTLLHIASRLNRRFALPDLAQTICQEISTALHLPSVSLSLLNPEGTHFVHAADVGFPPGGAALMKPFPVPPWLKGDLPLEELIRITAIENLTASPNYELYTRMGIVTGINVMLVRDKLLLGSLNLCVTDPARRFDDDDLALFRGVADVISQAILNAQLWEETLDHTFRMEDQVRQRTADLEAALLKAEAADRVKSLFISEMNHELRTPLTNITLYLDILASGREDRKERALETMRRETARLRQLIEDVLDMSRLDVNRLQIKPEKFYLNRLVGELLLDRASLLERAPVRVRYTPDDSLPPVAGDPNLLSRVVTNLLDNALNYAGSGEVHIRTGWEQRDERAWQVLTVADSGPGIAAEDLPHLFERFYRGAVARDKRTAGTGLGLAICQEIVERHGGSITVESRPGAGATFAIWLPADRA